MSGSFYIAKKRSVNIDDDFRINIAKELKERIEKAFPQIKRGTFIYDPNQVLSEEQLDRLCMHAENLLKLKTIDKNFDLLNLTGLLLFMLHSRAEPNIQAKDLALIEDSMDLADMNGYIRDKNVKALYVSLLKFTHIY